MRRRGLGRRPSVAGSMVRTAAVVGTASAVSGRSAQRQQAQAEQAQLAQAGAEAQQQAAIEAAVAQQVTAQGTAPAPVAGGPPSLTDDVVEQLKKLAELRDAGVLSEDEFATQKARFLGG